MTPQADGSYVGPKHLEQTIWSYLHIIETGQAKPSQQSYSKLVWSRNWLKTQALVEKEEKKI